MPAVALPSTSGQLVRVDMTPPGFDLLTIYMYPLTGLPAVDEPRGWASIPGARGCTAEACGFRDQAPGLVAAGVAVMGVSTQSTAYQREVVERLRLPFELLSDARLVLTRALQLPTFVADLSVHDGGGRKELMQRLTLIVKKGLIIKVFYPITHPETHAQEVLHWLAQQTV